MKYIPEYWNDIKRVIPCIPNYEKLFRKRIMITGATGMVCSSVVDVLVGLNNYYNAEIKLILAGRSEKNLLSRFADSLSKTEYEFVYFDATKNQNLNIKTDYIIYGASNANPAVYAKEPVETLVGNIVGLQTILEVARQNERSRTIYISSSEVYGNREEGANQFYKEDDYGYVDILNPRACYPNGKRTAETLCVSYGQEYGVDSVIVRLGHIYGPTITSTDTRATAEFTRDALKGQNIVMKSSGTQLRSYCYSLDCASAILSVLINGEKNNAYNVSNRDSIVSIRDVAEALAEEAKVEVIFQDPSDIERSSYNLMNNSALDAKKLEELGWKAIFPLEEGIRLTIRYGEP